MPTLTIELPPLPPVKPDPRFGYVIALLKDEIARHEADFATDPECRSARIVELWAAVFALKGHPASGAEMEAAASVRYFRYVNQWANDVGTVEIDGEMLSGFELSAALHAMPPSKFFTLCREHVKAS